MRHQKRYKTRTKQGNAMQMTQFLGNRFTTYLHVALLALGLCGVNYASASDFWAHGLGLRLDMPYGEDPAQRMDIYVHGERTGEPNYFAADGITRPTLIWIHGGGWIAGDKAAETAQFIPFLQRGWNVVNINYRQGLATAPAAVDDAMCAYRRVVEIWAAQNQPLNNFVVSGASAGGHLALTVGFLNADSEHPCKTDHPPQAIVNWYGITDIEEVDRYLNDLAPAGNYARGWAGSAAAIKDLSAQYSPLFLMSEATPPVITIHGTLDSVVPYEQATALHESLSSPNELVSIEGANHGGFSDQAFQRAYTDIFAFLANYIMPPKIPE